MRTDTDDGKTESSALDAAQESRTVTDVLIEALPKKQTLKFISASAFGPERLARYYSRCDYGICEYSVGVKLMWQSVYHYAFAEAGGCLLCRAESDGCVYFDYPVPGQDGDVEAALEQIEEYCQENTLSIRFSTVPQEALALLAARYDGTRTRNRYLWRDYIYAAEDIRSFSGKRFAGQRNHIHRFQKQCPGAVFRVMHPEDRPALMRFAERFARAYTKQGAGAMAEREAAFAALESGQSRFFRVGCMELDGEIVGVSLCEKCGDMLMIHIEKALAQDYGGVYPALFQATVREFAGDCLWINREDDAADMGLRTSKLQYQPVRMSGKYDVTVLNLFAMIRDIPLLKTERLVLDRIQPQDISAYGRLCRDDLQNRWWGYDYRTDLGIRPSDSDFYRMVNDDIAACRTLNFAIRRAGAFVGEAVLHHPNYRGEVELGVRILPEFGGNGYGREAFEAVSDWALYSLGAVRLRAMCFRENTRSRRMLSGARMRLSGEDGKMLYFVRTV